MRPLFTIGNKRSGTSHLVKLLNLHPGVFVTHESDIVWILYQAFEGREFRTYPWDGPLGMNATLEACHDMITEAIPDIRKPGLVATTFFRVLARLCSHGSAVQEVYSKEQLLWMGDKKPVQQADPDIQPFIHTHFPDARYIHIIRHPSATVGSMAAAGRSGWANVQYWQGSIGEILERWAIHEEWVLQAKNNSPVLTVRFEDLTERPSHVMSEVFSFLGLTLSADTAGQIVQSTQAGANEKYKGVELPRLDRAERIMKMYGYSP